MKISKVVMKAIEHIGHEGCLDIIDEMMKRAAFDTFNNHKEYMVIVARRFETWFGEPLSIESEQLFIAQLLEKGVLSKIR
jgi:hypothetical protein